MFGFIVAEGVCRFDNRELESRHPFLTPHMTRGLAKRPAQQEAQIAQAIPLGSSVLDIPCRSSKTGTRSSVFLSVSQKLEHRLRSVTQPHNHRRPPSAHLPALYVCMKHSLTVSATTVLQDPPTTQSRSSTTLSYVLCSVVSVVKWAVPVYPHDVGSCFSYGGVRRSERGRASEGLGTRVSMCASIRSSMVAATESPRGVCNPAVFQLAPAQGERSIYM